MAKSFVYFTLCMGLLSSSCDRTDPCACETMEEAPQAFLDYWYFPAGSWWVYALKDSAGVYDTVTVDWAQAMDYDYCDAEHNVREDAPCAKIYELSQLHSNTEYFKHPQNKPKTGLGSTIFGKYWTIDNTPTMSKMDGNRLFFQYPFEIGSFFLYNTAKPIAMDTIHSTGQPIAATHIELYMPATADSAVAGWMKEVWFASGVGMVKTRYTFNQVWELVDYHIAK